MRCISKLIATLFLIAFPSALALNASQVAASNSNSSSPLAQAIHVPAIHPLNDATTSSPTPSVPATLHPTTPASSAHGEGLACPEHEENMSMDNPLFWPFIITVIFLVSFGGLMSGLTVGFMSIDRLKLEVLKEAGTDEQKAMVEKVTPILDNHHLLLVTLLFCNAMAMEALPIFLDRLVPSFIAIIVSVTFVLVFGEVLPQAICTANPLSICATTAPLVRLLQVLSFPVAYPFARLLDRILGEHSAHVLFKRSELSTLISLHDEKKKGPLERDEANVIQGALEFSHKQAKDVMTDMEYVCMLEVDRKLDMDTMAEILGMGHSRIPVFHTSRHNVKGLLLVKRLIVCNPDDNRPVHHFCHRKPIVVPPTIGLYELLNVFQTGRSHLAIVTEHTREYKWAMDTGEDVAGYCRILGIVTLEDVVEELIKEEIEDEVDIGFSATARPIEKEEEREEHRKDGMERAAKVFRRLLHRIRRRKHELFLQQLYMPEYHQHQGAPVDASLLSMSEDGSLQYQHPSSSSSSASYRGTRSHSPSGSFTAPASAEDYFMEFDDFSFGGEGQAGQQTHRRLQMQRAMSMSTQSAPRSASVTTGPLAARQRAGSYIRGLTGRPRPYPGGTPSNGNWEDVNVYVPVNAANNSSVLVNKKRFASLPTIVHGRPNVPLLDGAGRRIYHQLAPPPPQSASSRALIPRQNSNGGPMGNPNDGHGMMGFGQVAELYVNLPPPPMPTPMMSALNPAAGSPTLRALDVYGTSNSVSNMSLGGGGGSDSDDEHHRGGRGGSGNGNERRHFASVVRELLDHRGSLGHSTPPMSPHLGKQQRSNSSSSSGGSGSYELVPPPVQLDRDSGNSQSILAAAISSASASSPSSSSDSPPDYEHSPFLSAMAFDKIAKSSTERVQREKEKAAAAAAAAAKGKSAGKHTGKFVGSEPISH